MYIIFSITFYKTVDYTLWLIPHIAMYMIATKELVSLFWTLYRAK